MPQDIPGVMREFGSGELHSGSHTGPVVTNRKQAIAIGISEQKKLKGGAYPKGPRTPSIPGSTRRTLGGGR